MSGLLTVCKGRRLPLRAAADQALSSRAVRLLLLITLFTAALAGCGGENEGGSDTVTGSGRGTVTCEGSAVSADVGLPADFPRLEGIMFVESEQRGPTRVVDGYAEESIDDVYDAFHSGFDDAGYEILFDEQEEADAEISYRATSDDTEGQVALRSCDEDTTSVHITNRPG